VSKTELAEALKQVDKKMDQQNEELRTRLDKQVEAIKKKIEAMKEQAETNKKMEHMLSFLVNKVSYYSSID
jgi:hypothetical protein